MARSILILLHCESGTGYAINPLEQTFFRMAENLCDGDRRRFFFSYPSMSRGPTPTLPADYSQYFILDPATKQTQKFTECERFLRSNNIDTIFGFDQPVTRPLYRHFRRGGVRHFISYWGAPMSSPSPWPRLVMKRLELALRRHGPDHYIFESHGMADLAVFGRGVPRRRTSVVYTGIDIDQWQPAPDDADYVYRVFGIPRSRRIFFYSGHMEERKGVRTLMLAANRLASTRTQDDWQLLILGNQEGQEVSYLQSLTSEARPRVLFGGYRSDLPRIHHGCYAGVIASTGWDSMTLSGPEMQASGLPVITSDLPGVREVVEDGKSGFIVPAKSETSLAEKMAVLLDDISLRNEMAAGARARALATFCSKNQVSQLTTIVRQVANWPARSPTGSPND